MGAAELMWVASPTHWLPTQWTQLILHPWASALGREPGHSAIADRHALPGAPGPFSKQTGQMSWVPD